MQVSQETVRHDLITSLEARARAANTLAELGFSIANDSYALLEFRQALVFKENAVTSRLLTVSGLARPAVDSPYLIWLQRTWPWLQQQLIGRPGWFELPKETSEVPPSILEGWEEWWPTGIFALPLQRRSGESLGWVCFLLDQPPADFQESALRQVVQTWSYCWEMLQGPNKNNWHLRWKALNTRRRFLAGLAIVIFLFLPIRQTALAPAEVIALDAAAVASPLDGVIKTIHIR
ncbi:MAG: hypothetical protein JZU65_06835, partial [Chlorobium sp.]|nr:hypothetical protein [Chlorobium sp.]